jgi:hypothetical protein
MTSYKKSVVGSQEGSKFAHRRFGVERPRHAYDERTGFSRFACFSACRRWRSAMADDKPGSEAGEKPLQPEST